MRNNQSTNQCAAQSCLFTSTAFVFWGTMAESVRGNFLGKACSKNNSSLERVDSRVQHIWRLRVMGSWRYRWHFAIGICCSGSGFCYGRWSHFNSTMRRDFTCASQVSPVSSVASPVFGSNLERYNVDFVFYSSLGLIGLQSHCVA